VNPPCDARLEAGLGADDQILGWGGKGGRKKALLFEKRSKNVHAAIADYSATAEQSFLVLFFKKELLACLH
jgi:hypothetical protein